jgi:hypothetical protein
MENNLDFINYNAIVWMNNIMIYMIIYMISLHIYTTTTTIYYLYVNILFTVCRVLYINYYLLFSVPLLRSIVLLLLLRYVRSALSALPAMTRRVVIGSNTCRRYDSF